MAAAIKDSLGLDSKLIEGKNGIFDVVAEGVKIYSKHETGRFPEHDEVLEALRAAGPGPAAS